MSPATRLLTAVTATAALVLLSVVPSTAATASITPGRSTPPTGGTTAIGAGISVLDDNAQLGERIPATVRASWHASAPTCPGSAGMEARHVAVTTTIAIVLDGGYQCSYVSAYAVGTGAVRWRAAYHFALNAVVSGSVVYIEHDDQSTFLNMLDARSLTTGKLLWTVEDDDGSDMGNISVGGGVVAAGDTIIDAATGKTRFFLADADASPLYGGTSLVWNNRIIYNAVNEVRAYSLTGAVLWTYAKPAGAGQTNWEAQIHSGLLYLPGWSTSSTGMLVLDPTTGKLVRRLPDSVAPVAFDGSTAIITVPNGEYLQQLRAVDLTTGTVYWKRDFPNSSAPNDQFQLPERQAAPVIENGIVWVYVIRDTGTPGRLIAYDEVTGAVRSTTVGACEMGNGTITIAQQRIFTPSACGVATYVAR